MNTPSYDVIVIGAGNAALCAALSAKEQGANVLVIERAPKELRGGNTAFAGAGFRVVYTSSDDVKKIVPDLTDDEIATTDFGQYTAGDYLDDLARTSEFRTDPDLAEMLVNSSADTVHWLQTKGIRFHAKYGDQAHKRDGKWQFFGGCIIRVVGAGLGLIEGQFKAVEKQGIPIRYNTRAVGLINGPSGVEGVRVIQDRVEEEIRARAVVIACGGFEANREWRTRYLGPGWDLAKVRGTRYNTGDGIQMALDVGAQACGNWSGAHACEWDFNAPEHGDLEVGDNFSKHSYPLSVMLNANGVRFLDEGENFLQYTYAKYGRKILEQPGQMAWQIFDSKVLSMLRGCYRIKKVTKVTADTLEGLVAKLEGVNKEQALKTLAEYNASITDANEFNPNIKDGRKTQGLAIPKSNWAQTIDKPPFEAYCVTCGITFTFGGLKITTNTEVVDVGDAPIPGLYAAGEAVGGIFYFNYPGGSGLVGGAVFGRLAGKNAAAHAAQHA